MQMKIHITCTEGECTMGTTERPPFYKRRYIVNKKLQFRIALIMILEIALISIVMSTIIVCLNDYYQDIFHYIAGPTELQTPLQEINKPVWMFMFGSITFSSVVFALVGIFLSHKIAGPLYRLKRHMIGIGKGSLPTELRFRKGDHLHDIADAFNEMVEGLRRRDAGTTKTLSQMDQQLTALSKELSNDTQQLDDKRLKKCIEELQQLIHTETVKYESNV